MRSVFIIIILKEEFEIVLILFTLFLLRILSSFSIYHKVCDAYQTLYLIYHSTAYVYGYDLVLILIWYAVQVQTARN